MSYSASTKAIFIGFSPSEFVRSYVGHLLDHVEDESPKHSKIEVTIRKTGTVYKGVLDVRSKGGDFVVVASSKRLKDVVHMLSDRLRKKLKKWKAQKLSRKKVRDIPLKYPA